MSIPGIVYVCQYIHASKSLVGSHELLPLVRLFFNLMDLLIFMMCQRHVSVGMFFSYKHKPPFLAQTQNLVYGYPLDTNQLESVLNVWSIISGVEGASAPPKF